MARIFNKVWFVISILAIYLLGGTLGYIWTENYSFTDALYMTVITFSTVGFREVKPE